MAGEGPLSLWCFCFLVLLLALCFTTCWGKRWKDLGKAEEVLWRPWNRLIFHSVASVALAFHTEKDSDEGRRRRVEWEKERGGGRDSLGRSVHCALSASSHTENYVFFHILKGCDSRYTKKMDKEISLNIGYMVNTSIQHVFWRMRIVRYFVKYAHLLSFWEWDEKLIPILC